MVYFFIRYIWGKSYGRQYKPPARVSRYEDSNIKRRRRPHENKISKFVKNFKTGMKEFLEWAGLNNRFDGSIKSVTYPNPSPRKTKYKHRKTSRYSLKINFPEIQV